MEKFDKLFSIKTTTKMIYRLILIFMVINLLTTSSTANIDEKFERIVDYISLPYREMKNVTCIPHETTFTCDCDNSDENMNLSPLSGHVYQISVRNCKSLQVSSNLLKNTQALRTVEFTNVENLVLQPDSLSFPASTSNMPLNLKFNKVQIEKIYSNAISGNIQEISFYGGTIGTIQAFGIKTRLEANILKFDSMFIDRIEAQAFKKFSVNTLEITNSAITSNLPSRSFYDIKITDNFIIHNVTFKEVHTNAFLLEDVSKLIITNNNFDAVDGEWIVTGVKSSILIKDNNFGNTSSLAFKGIKQNKDYIKSERLEFRLQTNTIHQATEPVPLEFNTNFNLIITNLFYLNSFPCYYKDKKFELFNTYPDTIYFQSHKDSYKKLSIRKIIENECTKLSYLEYIIGGCIGLLILLILIGVLICYCVMKKRKAKRKLDIVVPEPRTYKETQIVLQIENAGLLKTDL